MKENAEIIKFKNKFTYEQWRIGKWIAIFTGILLIGVIIMSVLGSEYGSFHIISLTGGWSGRLWDYLWMTITASTFFILGGIACKYLESIGNDSETSGGKG